MSFLRKVRQLIVDSLGFSKTEANGFLILITLVVLIAIVPRIYFRYEGSELNSYESNTSLEEWATEMNTSISKKKKFEQSVQSHTALKSFNPNLATLEQMMNGGLPKYLAERVKKYREKGGTFKEREDLKKMYGMTDSLFSHIKSFLVLPPIKVEKYGRKDTARFQPKWSKKELVRFNLNKATPEELQNVSGIGPVLSERIVKYRDLLGGFYSVDQLKEVWGLKEVVIENVISQSDFSGQVKHTTINTDSIKLLARHPYIDYNLARAIINYREVHGVYKSMEELRKIKVMNDSLYQKLSPYLSL
ncbi:MAG: hypothetical protein GY816_16370 [Cytophagales bacterium]|nr:hypothetical protein [Cytophagales bacterium]